MIQKAKVRGGICHRRFACSTWKRANRRSVTLETERRAVEREVLVRHRANRGLVGHEPRKVGAEVAVAVAVAFRAPLCTACCACSIG